MTSRIVQLVQALAPLEARFLEVCFCTPRDSLRFDSNLAELTGRHRDLSTKIKPRRAGWSSGHKGHAAFVEHLIDIREHSPEVWPIAGCQDDRIKAPDSAVGKHDIFCRQTIDAAPYLDGAVP